MKLPLLLCVFFAALLWSGAVAMASTGEKPNIIYILADDWGLGDVKTYGGERCKIDTPHMDRLAEKGMKFTDAHSSSSVCTPTRYSILTGRYNWRSSLKSGVLWGFSKRLIEPGRETVASLLKKNGYTTNAIGKWHLGMDFPTTNGKAVDEKGKNTDWKGRIKNGPTAMGFDKYWGISASLDMPPYIWIENDRFVGECTTQKSFHPNRRGPAHADFEAVNVLPTLTERAVSTITDQAKSRQPFFIYMPLNSPHSPTVPSKGFQGKSSLGFYGDFVMETDWAVGQVVEAVERAGIADNTLIIVTADNGCSNWPLKHNEVNDPARFKFRMGKNPPDDPEAHYPSDVYRGHKADIYEGGHRVPFIARWDGKVKPGSVSSDPVCLVDLFATCAEIIGAKTNDSTAEDSVSILPALLGKSTKPVREAVVHHSMDGSFAIRQGKWKLALCPGSGGWSKPVPPSRKKNPVNEEPIKDWVQLFDLEADPAETKNLASNHPEIVANLTALVQKYIDTGRSTPGAPQKNNGETLLYPDWIRKGRQGI